MVFIKSNQQVQVQAHPGPDGHISIGGNFRGRGLRFVGVTLFFEGADDAEIAAKLLLEAVGHMRESAMAEAVTEGEPAAELVTA
jgi:hypothetical protein